MGNIYETVLDQILKKLEQDQIPWIKEWGSSGYAKNWVTGKDYQGVNILLTEPGKEYATFNQIKEAGGRVVAGAKGIPIVFFSPVSSVSLKQIAKENELTGKLEALEDNEAVKACKSVILKKYIVFEVGKYTEGIELKYQAVRNEQFTPIEKAEAVIKNYKNVPKIVESGGNRAYWRPSQDLIQMPTRQAFRDENSFYKTLFHELVHSTGSKDRLNRDMSGAFGSAKYAKEELVAEIGSSYLMAYCNLNPCIENTTAYCQSWIKCLKDNDPKMLMQAATQAYKAINYIQGKDLEIHVETVEKPKKSVFLQKAKVEPEKCR